MNFGTFIKEIRIAAEITLREFSRRIGIDPSNWSKMERGITPPPTTGDLLKKISATLSLSPEQEQEMTDLAALARRELPVDLDDEELLAKMPAFFRALKGREYTAAEFDDLIEDVRKIHKPD